MKAGELIYAWVVSDKGPILSMRPGSLFNRTVGHWSVHEDMEKLRDYAEDVAISAGTQVQLVLFEASKIESFGKSS
jgi:hypothetical protein